MAETIFVYRCTECGADYLLRKRTLQGTCPYCGGLLKSSETISDEMTIEKIVPFGIGKADAITRMRKYLKKMATVPEQFMEEAHLREVRGIFVPFYLLDLSADAELDIEQHETSEYKEYPGTAVETVVYGFTQYCSAEYRQIPIRASRNMSVELMESIEPFDCSEIAPFSADAIGEYMVDYSDEPFEPLYPEIERRVRQETANQAFTMAARNGDVRPAGKEKCSVKPENMIYAWLPVWILRTEYEGQNYLLVMNGRSGKIAGKLPEDRKKKIFVAGLIFVLAEVLMYVLFYRKLGRFSLGSWIFRYVIIPTILTVVGSFIVKKRLSNEVELPSAEDFLNRGSVRGHRSEMKRLRTDREVYSEQNDWE